MGNYGGAIDPGRDPEGAVRQEIVEECGYVGPVDLIPLLEFQSGDFRYFNFLAVVEDEFNPLIGWESQGFRWCQWGEWPEPLHFGLQALFEDRESIERIQAEIARGAQPSSARRI